MVASLYQRVGGERIVRAVIVKMYGKILIDPELAPFFRDINMDRLRRSQTSFVNYAFGGPTPYTGKSMRDAHRGAVMHGLNDDHFDRVINCLSEAMQALNIAPALIAEATAIVEGTRNDVLGKPLASTV